MNEEGLELISIIIQNKIPAVKTLQEFAKIDNEKFA
jgi:hypothetical protein